MRPRNQIKNINFLSTLGEVQISTSKELTEYFITNEPKSPTLIQGEEGEVLLKIVFKRRIIQAELQDIKPFL